MECFAKLVNGKKLLTIFAKCSILDIIKVQGSKYVCYETQKQIWEKGVAYI